MANSITYRHDGLSPFKITVKINGRVSGYIRRNGSQYRYEPRGALRSMMGEWFPTVGAVMRSLEQ